MPKLRMTADDRRKELFGKKYRVHKALLNLTNDDVARVVGLTRETLRNQMTHLTHKTRGLRLGTWLYLVSTWTDDEIIAFVRGKQL